MRLRAGQSQRSCQAASLYDPVIPAVDGALSDLTRIHSDDPAAPPDPGRTANISDAFDALTGHIDQLITRETVDAEDKQAELLAIGTRATPRLGCPVT